MGKEPRCTLHVQPHWEGGSKEVPKESAGIPLLKRTFLITHTSKNAPDFFRPGSIGLG